ncbi:MAG: SEC-C metal-binding domain-containing protein [Bacteroidaceae bacterium]|nr:SEC-C metal-binding domain-containing protein [Bacteroidaceae bacterium]
MNYTTAFKIRYYSKDNSTEIKTKIQEKLDPSISNISHEMLCLFSDILNKEPSYYWKDMVYNQTYTQLEILYKSNSTSIRFDETVLEHFLIGYHTYYQITDIINDLANLNDSPDIKNRLYRIPTYVSIVEGCLTNLFRVITLILDQTSAKDFASAKNLNPLCEILKSNGFDSLISDVNINVRNAINHGGVIFKENGQKIEFHYTEDRRAVLCSMKAYEFDNLIEQVYDTASGTLLGICSFLNKHIDLIVVNKNEKLFVPFCLLGMELSIPSIRCKSISESPDGKQINVDIHIENSDRTFILQTAIELSILVFERYNDYQKYFLSFSNERLQTSWVRFSNQDIKDMISENRTLATVVADIIRRQECIIWDPSTEDVDLQEIKYYRFPNYNAPDFKINKVKDASSSDRKRLRAHLFIGDVLEKDKILEIIHNAINWLKLVRNVPSPTLPHKYGDMEADSLYINVYRYDSRKNKELFPNNDNFVCFVDYNISGETTLKNGGLLVSIWRQLHHEKIDNVEIAWRERKYAISGKQTDIGRNDPCPCGSGKKYKKCCGK